MTKAKFSQWMLKVFAAVMQVFFPMLAIKKFTKNLDKKGNPCKEKASLFCPGVKQEIKAIEKFGFLASDIRERQWSYETRLELLENKNYALISRIATEKELDIVVKHGDSLMIATALKVNVPKKNWLLRFICGTKHSIVSDVMFLQPTAFNALNVNDILVLPIDCKIRWNYLEILVQAERKASKLHRWSLEVMKAYADIYNPSDINDDASKVFYTAFSVAIEKLHDISSLLPFLEKNYPNLYDMIWKNYAKFGENIVPMAVERLPKIVQRLDDKVECLSINAEDGDARTWLFINAIYIARPEVMRVVLDNWDIIVQKCHPNLVNEIINRISLEVVDIGMFKEIYPKIPKEMQPQYCKRLLYLVYQKLVPAKELGMFFPFTDWDEKSAKNAINLMAAEKALPLERLNELNSKLKSRAEMVLETQAEMAIIESGDKEDLMELIKNKLHAKSELYLFRMAPLTNKGIIKAYNQMHKIDDYTFNQLILADWCSDLIQEFIFDYASQWGISSENYKKLLQSPYAKLAVFVKKSVGKEPKKEPRRFRFSAIVDE